MRIGLFSPVWLPNHGGVAMYNYQLALTLERMGHTVSIFTATASDPQKDNGSIKNIVRDSASGFGKRTWLNWAKQPNNPDLSQLFAHYSLMNQVPQWASTQELEMVLVSVPFQETVFFHAREMYRSLQARGIRVGALHYDISPQLLHLLNRRYLKSQDGWETVADELTQLIHTEQHRYSKIESWHRIGSPFFFEPDFVISTSHWSERFIASPSQERSFVCHPILDSSYWQTQVNHNPLDQRDILMINPQSRKGPKVMLKLIESSTQETFRILEGGWGEAFKEFLPQLKGMKAYQDGRVVTHRYIEDMRCAYQQARLVFFPSYVEGYGMTAIEPMYGGTPVVSSNYPAILEAVGDGAYLLCPFRSKRQAWQKAVHEVLENEPYWRQQSLDRAQALIARQVQEIDQLKEFLQAQL
jgi:glycosyltransferase involved in cell wall biosynthesis